MSNIKTYIVGGAVRDTLLDRAVKDVDYVVVGATPTIMLNLGFNQVGADFPVFLHRTTGDEYALARTERKTGQGYNGFETNYSPAVTLDDDLSRRDLTINAMAVGIDDWDEFKKTKNEKLVIDRFNGLEDLKNSKIRHVSEAFAEDPVRVLRVARFVARYNFMISDETTKLMKQLVEQGEMNALTQERVYLELEKAMMEDFPILFFEVLDIVGAMPVLFPELISDDRLPVLIGESLTRAVAFDRDLIDRLMMITAGLKTDAVVEMFERLKAPNDVIRAVKMSTTLIRMALAHSFSGFFTGDIIKAFDEVNAWKNVDMFQKVMNMFVIFDNDHLRNLSFHWVECLKVANKAKFAMLTNVQKETLKGVEIQQAIANERVELLEHWFNR